MYILRGNGNLKLQIARYILIVVIIIELFILMYDFIFLKVKFLKNFNEKSQMLNSKIISYQSLEKQLNEVNYIIEKDKKISAEFMESSIINKKFNVKEFNSFFSRLINSRRFKIEELNVDVMTDFPIIFNDNKEVLIDVFLKVGDIVE